MYLGPLPNSARALVLEFIDEISERNWLLRDEIKDWKITLEQAIHKNPAAEHINHILDLQQIALTALKLMEPWRKCLNNINIFTQQQQQRRQRNQKNNRNQNNSKSSVISNSSYLSMPTTMGNFNELNDLDLSDASDIDTLLHKQFALGMNSEALHAQYHNFNNFKAQPNINNAAMESSNGSKKHYNKMKQHEEEEETIQEEGEEEDEENNNNQNTENTDLSTNLTSPSPLNPLHRVLNKSHQETLLLNRLDQEIAAQSISMAAESLQFDPIALNQTVNTVNQLTMQFTYSATASHELSDFLEERQTEFSERVLYIFTMVSVIVAPMQLLTNMYGMNFDQMNTIYHDESNNYLQFWIVTILLMVSIAALLFRGSLFG